VIKSSKEKTEELVRLVHTRWMCGDDYHVNNESLLAFEVYDPKGHGRIDAVVIDRYESNGYALTGLELKVSRQDLQNELLSPEKSARFFKHLDHYALVLYNLDLMKGLDIPSQWGIYYPDGKGSLRAKRRPKPLHPGKMRVKRNVDKSFAVSLMTALSRRGSATENQKMLREAYKKGYAAGIEEEKEIHQRITNRLKGRLEVIQEIEKLSGEKLYFFNDRSIKEFAAVFKAFNEGHYQKEQLLKVVEARKNQISLLEEVINNWEQTSKERKK